jgi:hypothetical protein
VCESKLYLSCPFYNDPVETNVGSESDYKFYSIAESGLSEVEVPITQDFKNHDIIAVTDVESAMYECMMCPQYSIFPSSKNIFRSRRNSIRESVQDHKTKL